jgi:tight adherence protein B
MARAMQAGHAFSSALRLVAAETLEPIASEFQTVFDEINFGLSTEQALSNLAVRVSSRDLRYFVVAVLIQRETGGNLSEVLVSIARLIRERQKLLATVHVLSAEARISAWVLTILPFVLGAVIAFVNRRFLAQLWTDPIGIDMLAASTVLMAIGIWWMWRMVRFRI